MAKEVAETIRLAREQERLRQARETFDQRKSQDKRWHALRLYMGWTAGVILPGVAAISGWVLFSYAEFPVAAVTFASAALLGDVLGVVGFIWKGMLPGAPQTLSPVLLEESPEE